MLGYYGTYTEWTKKIIVNDTYWNAEFYIQDNWRVTKRLTFDYGLRFYHHTPETNGTKEYAWFDQAAYTKAGVPRLYVPAIVNGKRVAQDPGTGATAPVAAIGLYVPNTGNPANGMVQAGTNGARMNPYDTAPVWFAPRIGFAYDVFGNGKTAMRGGVGVFYDRLDGNQAYDMGSNPPIVYAPTAYYNQIGALSTSGGLLGPSNLIYWAGHTRPAQTRSASFGIQQNIGFGTVLDVSYQGTFGLNRNVRENMNAIPIGADYLPQHIDPSASIIRESAT